MLHCCTGFAQRALLAAKIHHSPEKRKVPAGASAVAYRRKDANTQRSLQARRTHVHGSASAAPGRTQTLGSWFLFDRASSHPVPKSGEAMKTVRSCCHRRQRSLFRVLLSHVRKQLCEPVAN